MAIFEKKNYLETLAPSLKDFTSCWNLLKYPLIGPNLDMVDHDLQGLLTVLMQNNIRGLSGKIYRIGVSLLLRERYLI